MTGRRNGNSRPVSSQRTTTQDRTATTDPSYELIRAMSCSVLRASRSARPRSSKPNDRIAHPKKVTEANLL